MTDEVRDMQLAGALKAWGDDPGSLDQAVGDVAGYLQAYYHRVDTEDLPEPARLAEVARAHAEMALRRPQGRALVQVREESGGTFSVDIVTDDMPYLVDSVTTELNRHRADIDTILHPLLRVRRDVTGGMRGIRGGPWTPADQRVEVPDELTESWIHVEIGRPGDRIAPDRLAADLRHVLEDVRVAVEDQPRMSSTAMQLAVSLAGERSPGIPAAAGEEAALLEWLAAGHFTFLGFREYDLVHGPDGVGLRAVPGSGLGILRHDRKGSLVEIELTRK